MNGLPYYKRYPRDFVEGTIGLGLELKTAYAFLLDLIYMQGGKLPDNSRYISGLLECHPRKWFHLRKQLIEAGKIEAADGYLRNKRVDNELLMSRQFQDKQSSRASGPRKNKDLQNPRPSHTDTDTDIVPNGTIRRTPRDELLEVLDEERAEAVIAHRQRIGSPLTQRAGKMLATSLAQWPDPNAAADEMLARGWRGFKPEWMESRRNGNGKTTFEDIIRATEASLAADRDGEDAIEVHAGRAEGNA